MNSHDSAGDREPPALDDVHRAQRQAREPGPVDFAAYLRFLAQFPDADPAVLRRRRGPRGEPFKL